MAQVTSMYIQIMCFSLLSHNCSKELFLPSAPYVNYIRKDPGAPCSLTEALEFLQVDVLEDLMKKDRQAASQGEAPKHKPHNLTVVAMEGCHSFIILDWARPLKGDMVSGETFMEKQELLHTSILWIKYYLMKKHCDLVFENIFRNIFKKQILLVYCNWKDFFFCRGHDFLSPIKS